MTSIKFVEEDPIPNGVMMADVPKGVIFKHGNCHFMKVEVQNRDNVPAILNLNIGLVMYPSREQLSEKVILLDATIITKRRQSA
jgi:hypothetical protein